MVVPHRREGRRALAFMPEKVCGTKCTVAMGYPCRVFDVPQERVARYARRAALKMPTMTNSSPEAHTMAAPVGKSI